MKKGIGVSVPKKESNSKVTGVAKYTDDIRKPNYLHAKILTSPHAHAKIISIDTSEAKKHKGVMSVITGDYLPKLTGTILRDRPPIAINKVRYYGEPVALIVAKTEEDAMNALKLIKIEYEVLPVVNKVVDAVKPNATLVHEHVDQYQKVVKSIYPQANSNVSDVVNIRKGDINQAFSECDVTVEAEFDIPQADHVAMETRVSTCEITPDKQVIIHSSSQAPFAIRQEISKIYGEHEGNVIVKVPLIGGGFGGKATIQTEFLAYLASRSVNGKLVHFANSREEDIKTAPCKMGLHATVKLGALKDGTIKAMQCEYLIDSGAYADIGPRMAKAIAVDCSGPYDIESVYCDALCVYTNHTYATSYRGFSHVSYTFCLERMIEKLAYTLGMDSFDIRFKNLIKEGDYTPTQVLATKSNIGNIKECLTQLKQLINWDEGIKVEKNGLIKTKGICCFWKTSDSPVDAIAGVVLTFNKDGSLNINCGAVEMGPGTKTALCQILAQKMEMDVKRIHIKMDVDTQVSPVYWKTVASMSTFMVGRAIIRAADDLIRQLKSLASVILKVNPEDLAVTDEKVFLVDRPDISIKFKEICHGYEYKHGSAVEGQIIGRGSYIMRHLTPLNPSTGIGKSGPGWTVGAQAVEIEYDPELYTYRLLKGITVIDAGKVLNPKGAEAVVMGGMNMGFGLATREEFIYNEDGRLEDTSLRTYHIIRSGEQPVYTAKFVEEDQIQAPYGIRGIGEHGIIGIPAAFGNALSTATNLDIRTFPMTPEKIWSLQGGKQ